MCDIVNVGYFQVNFWVFSPPESFEVASNIVNKERVSQTDILPLKVHGMLSARFWWLVCVLNRLVDAESYIFVDHILWICHHLKFQLDWTFQPLGEHFFCVSNEEVNLQQIFWCTIWCSKTYNLTFWGCKLRFIKAATLQGNMHQFKTDLQLKLSRDLIVLCCRLTIISLINIWVHVPFMNLGQQFQYWKGDRIILSDEEVLHEEFMG